MISLLVKIYKTFYWRIFHRLWRLAERYYTNECFYNLFKKEDFKYNVLSDEQKLEIDNFYKKNYGKKISYTWHNLFTRYSGKFDVRYIPVDIFTKFIYSFNANGLQYDIIKDKNFLYEIANFANVKLPKRYFHSINNIFFDSDNNITSKEEFYNKISDIGEVFIKPTRLRESGYARGCIIVKIIDGTDVYSNTSIKKIIETNYCNKDFLVQEKLISHKTFSEIYPKSVNTVSVTTLFFNNEIKVLNPILKIGAGGNIFDWNGFDKKGFIISMDKDGFLYDLAYSPNEKKWYSCHPDTGVVFKKYKIENLKKVLDAAIKMHSSVMRLPFCRWDFVVDEQGDAVVIDNETPSCMLDQISYGEGFFGADTEEILSYLKNR